jgi:hypothetical protein
MTYVGPNREARTNQKRRAARAGTGEMPCLSVRPRPRKFLKGGRLSHAAEKGKKGYFSKNPLAISDET